ncbi:MAG: TSUP family transporter [Nevskia sp.]|nr:TSUP family transporter [Nevskia sp.]
MILAALCGFAFLAGFVDSVVGGGGLIQIPAMFVLLPQLPPALLFGTNKFSSVWGTLSAALRYGRRMPPIWHSVLPTALAALACSYAGARTVSLLDPALLRPLILALLAAVLVYTLWNKDFGRLHAPRLDRAGQLWCGLATGACLGFYDGFFGPGTGSFLIFAFVGLFGFSFLAASASAKIVNVVTNVAALAYFMRHGDVLYATAVPMAACNVAGSLAGSHLALRHGSGFVRLLFIGVVTALLARFAYDLLS